MKKIYLSLFTSLLLLTSTSVMAQHHSDYGHRDRHGPNIQRGYDRNYDVYQHRNNYGFNNSIRRDLNNIGYMQAGGRDRIVYRNGRNYIYDHSTRRYIDVRDYRYGNFRDHCRKDNVRDRNQAALIGAIAGGILGSQMANNQGSGAAIGAATGAGLGYVIADDDCR